MAKVSPKLLKSAGSAMLPFLMTVYRVSATTSQVPDLWKMAKVSAIYKEEDDMDKNNYRPISLLCIPGKVMETTVASTITIGVWAGGAGRAAAPPNFGQLSFFGQQEKFGQKVFKKFPFFSRDKFIDIFYYQ